MKIVYVYPKFTALAGTERVLIDKMNYLAEHEDVEVVALTYEQGNRPFVYSLSPKVLHIDLDVSFDSLKKYNQIIRVLKVKQFNILLRRKFNQLMNSLSPDIVISTTFHANIASIIANCPTSFAKILESHIDKRYIHCNDPENRQHLFNYLWSVYNMLKLSHNARKYDVLVSLHQSDANDWAGYLKTRVITNIIHLNTSGRYSSLESKRVIFAGRFAKQKGIPDLFEIWRMVAAHHADWCLELYGNGNVSELPYTEEEREKLNIHVYPANPNIFDKYLDSSLFVLTSIYEPFGLVMLEAMSCGLPVIAFDCPHGPAQIITDGVDGFLIKDRNHSFFAEKLCALIESDELRKKMGHAAVLSSQRYAAPQIMAEWMNLFKELMNKKTI